VAAWSGEVSCSARHLDRDGGYAEGLNNGGPRRGHDRHITTFIITSGLHHLFEMEIRCLFKVFLLVFLHLHLASSEAGVQPLWSLPSNVEEIEDVRPLYFILYIYIYILSHYILPLTREHATITKSINQSIRALWCRCSRRGS
jgi:hypothetical protein